MKKYLLSLTIPFLLISCASYSPKDVDKSLLERCQGSEVYTDPYLINMCSFESSKYTSYNDVPIRRFLVNPKYSYLVESSRGVELRLYKTEPIVLRKNISDKILFTSDYLSEPVRNKMHYKEFYDSLEMRRKIMMLTLPYDTGGLGRVCIEVIQKRKLEKNQKNQVKEIDCKILNNS